MAAIGPLGASAAFPEPPEYSHSVEGDHTQAEVFSLTTPRKGDAPAHGLICTVVGHELMINLEKAADITAKKWKQREQRTRVTRGGRAGIELRGKVAGGPVSARVEAMGRWVCALFLEGGTVHPEEEDAFFASFTWDPPWRLEVFPEQAVTVSLPGPIATGELKPVGDEGGWVQLYLLSVQPEITLGVSVSPRAMNQKKTEDELLDDAVGALKKMPDAKMEEVERVRYEGSPGRNVTYTQRGVRMRARLVLGPRFLVQLVVATTTATDAFDAASRARFFDSLRLIARD